MKRSLFRLFLPVLAAFLLLCGCTRLYDGAYISVTEHEETELNSDSGGQYYLVHTYAGMRNALEELIRAGTESGVIRAQDYDGSVQDDIARICQDVTKENALGAYAVEFITHSVNRILSYDEVQLSIRYRISEEERNAIVGAPSLAEMYHLVDNALTGGAEKLTVQVATLAVTERTLVNYVESFYRQNPDKLSAQPTVSVTFYPDESSVSKVIAFAFSYRYSREEERARLGEVKVAADKLTGGLVDLTEAEYALICCRLLRDTALARSSGNTAYDVLATGGGDPEGFAMAYQLLCSRFGLDCQVVEGRKNGSNHDWNIIKLGRNYYHVDAYACASEELQDYFLLSDGELIGEYWWDVDRYPNCKGDLRPEQVLELYLARQGGGEAAGAETDAVLQPQS